MKKDYIKKNIIGFIIGVFLCIGTFVYAAVTFPSSDVSYDNKESGLSSTTVKGAIDELYTECTKEPTAGEIIIEDAGLEKDPYECRYFFTGANPNNYISFNEEKDVKAGWWIISVECDGTIKIMRIASIGNMSWDNLMSNNWTRPVTLNTYLNELYYNELSSIAQSQIVAKDWSVGGVIYDNNSLVNQIDAENADKWHGKVALATVSKYIRSNSNKSSCGSFGLNNDNYSICKNTGWMYYSSTWWWTLSSSATGSGGVFYVDYRGNIETYNASGTNISVHPALYISSEAKITGGDGSRSNPYEISL